MCVCALRAPYAVRVRECGSARSENENWEITPKDTLDRAVHIHVSCVYFQHERIPAKADNVDEDGNNDATIFNPNYSALRNEIPTIIIITSQSVMRRTVVWLDVYIFNSTPNTEWAEQS